MRLDYAFLADKATLTHDKKLVVVGGDIDTANVPDLPAMLQATLVARMVLDVGESPEGHTFGLECTTATGERKKIAENRRISIDRMSEPGSPSASRLILDLTFVASHEGPHSFHLIVDGNELKTIPFRVKLLKAEE